MSEVKRISRAFKDISLSFKPHPVTGDLPVIKNERAIMRSVRNIVQTIPGEKFFDPIFGSDVYNSLFELVDPSYFAIIEDQILVALNNFEPRIDNIKVTVEGDPDRNEMDVTVAYDIVGEEFPRQNFNFILKSTR